MDRYGIGGLTMCTSRATLAAGSTTTISSTGTINYSIRGKAYSHAALSNTATPTTDAATGLAFIPIPIGSGCAFIVGFNAAGTLQVVQGTIVTLDASGAFTIASQFGGMPTDFCAIGYVTVRLAPASATTPAVATWTFGTNNLAPVTGVTFAYQDLMTIPDRPQIS